MATEMIDDNTMKVKQELESGWFQWTELDLPASLTIQSGINAPRYASLRGIMMAKNKPVQTTEINASEYPSLVSLKKIYIPSKSKETQFIEGTSEEIASSIVTVLANEIKIL